MAASGRSFGFCNCDDGVVLRPPPPSPCSSQPTCWELPSTDSKTPNPRPTKTMRTEESSDPPIPTQPSYEVVMGVDVDVPPPLVDEVKPLPEGEGRAEPKIIEFPYDTDDDVDGWGYLPPGVELEKERNVKDKKDDLFYDSDDWSPPASSPGPEKCDVCDGGHYTCCCVYLSRIPPGEEITNYQDYEGKCDNDSCLRWGQDETKYALECIWHYIFGIISEPISGNHIFEAMLCIIR